MGITKTELVWGNGHVIYDGLYHDGYDVYKATFEYTVGRIIANGSFNLKDPGSFIVDNSVISTATDWFNYIYFGRKYYVCYDRGYSADIEDENVISASTLEALIEPYHASKYRHDIPGFAGYVEAADIAKGDTVLIPVNMTRDKLLSTRSFHVGTFIKSGEYGERYGYFSLYKQVDYHEADPEASIIYPSGQTLDNHRQITFQWEHTTDKGWKPYGFDLQYSYNGVVWNDLASVSPIGNTTPQPTSYTAPAYTFDVGVVYWRVRTYNTMDTAGEWAVGSFIADSAPDAPVIQSVTTTPVPTIRWTANEQAAFRVTIGNLFDSGVIYGTATSYTAPTVLPDGSHIVTLSVANASGKWTASTASVDTANTPSGSVALTGSVTDMSAALSWTKTGTFTRLYLLRDGVPIKDITGLASTKDALFPGTGTYTVRGLITGGNYTDSNSVTLAEDAARSLSIVPIAAGNPVQLRYNLGASPQHDRSTSAAQEYTHYAGRALPVASLSGHLDVTHALNYAIDSANIHALSVLVGKAICIRDRYGRAFGVLESAQAKYGKRYTALTLSLTEIDYQEAVDYVV